MRLVLVLSILASVVGADDASSTSRHVEVHLFGADMSEGAPLALWYHAIGITDVWLYPLKGAFPQDQKPETQKTVADLEASGVLKAYRDNSIRYWWMERPVPDVLYQNAKRADVPKSNLWDDTPETDALWAEVCAKIAAIYPAARAAGFRGAVYDNEAYYSYQGDECGKDKPWVWGGHSDEYGRDGNYYKRGVQVGKAIHAAWPKAKIIMVYAFGYEGEAWWYRGVQDGGVNLYLGPEHTYGAGPGDFGNEYYQTWWKGRNTKQTCDWKRTQFPFIADNQHIIAGLFPIDFGAKRPNYRAKDFRAQLHSAANDEPNGPIAVWIWPQGPFTPESWTSIAYAPGDSAESYLQALRDYSRAFVKQE